MTAGTDPRCGTTAGYRAHKRGGTETCTPCRSAQAAWQRAYEIRRYVNRGPLQVDATGTRRRLRALASIGWPFLELGNRMGMTPGNLHRVFQQDRVYRTTAAKVAALYDELSMTSGPSQRARDRARSKGWFPPLAWDDDTIDTPAARASGGTALRKTEGMAFDEIAVGRAMRGERVALRPVERAEAVRRLTALGLSAAQVAARLRIESRSVQRLRGPRPEAAA